MFLLPERKQAYTLQYCWPAFLESMGLDEELGRSRYFLFGFSDGEEDLVWYWLVNVVLIRQMRTEIADDDFALMVSLGHGFSVDVVEVGH